MHEISGSVSIQARHSVTERAPLVTVIRATVTSPTCLLDTAYPKLFHSFDFSLGVLSRTVSPGYVGENSAKQLAIRSLSLWRVSLCRTRVLYIKMFWISTC